MPRACGGRPAGSAHPLRARPPARLAVAGQTRGHTTARSACCAPSAGGRRASFLPPPLPAAPPQLTSMTSGSGGTPLSRASGRRSSQAHMWAIAFQVGARSWLQVCAQSQRARRAAGAEQADRQAAHRAPRAWCGYCAPLAAAATPSGAAPPRVPRVTRRATSHTTRRSLVQELDFRKPIGEGSFGRVYLAGAPQPITSCRSAPAHCLHTRALTHRNPPHARVARHPGGRQAAVRQEPARRRGGAGRALPHTGQARG